MKKFKGKTLKLKEADFHFLPEKNCGPPSLMIAKKGKCLIVIRGEGVLKIQECINHIFSTKGKKKK